MLIHLHLSMFLLFCTFSSVIKCFSFLLSLHSYVRPCLIIYNQCMLCKFSSFFFNALEKKYIQKWKKYHDVLYMLYPGPTAIHVAARCGALDTVACLLANFANILAIDQDGWAPVHHAAFFDHYPVVRLMVRKNKGLLELVTKNE